MLHASERVTGGILWANVHLLFWLSLVPFVTAWMGENDFPPVPVACYGAVMFMCGVAFNVLARMLARLHGPQSTMRCGRSDATARAGHRSSLRLRHPAGVSRPLDFARAFTYWSRACGSFPIAESSGSRLTQVSRQLSDLRPRVRQTSAVSQHRVARAPSPESRIPPSERNQPPPQREPHGVSPVGRSSFRRLRRDGT